MGVSGRHYREGILRNTSLLVRGISMAEAQFSSMNSQGQQVLNSSCLQATMETKPLSDITHHGNPTHTLDHDSTELDKADMLLIFVLETTSLRKSSDICHIQAEVLGPYSKWSCHLIPEKDIAQSATAVNKLRVKTTSEGTRVLMKKGAVVPALRYRDGLNEFYKFLCELSREQKKINPNARLILAAHKQLHQEVLLQAFTKIYVASNNLNSIGVWFPESFSFVKEESMVGAAKNKEMEQPKNGIHKTKALLDSNNDKWLVNLTFAAHDQRINNSKVAGTTKIKHPPPIPSSPATPHDAIILFDLETTGLPRTSDICQIGAQVLGEEEVWIQYLVPTINISPEASSVTGLTVEMDENRQRILCKNGIPVEAKSYTEGLQAFYDYLCQLSRKQRELHPNARLVLVAHNCKSFDAPILLNAFRAINVPIKKLNELKVCFSDSLLILRKLQRENHPLLYDTQPFPIFKTQDESTNNKALEEEKLFKVSLGLTRIYYHLFGEDFPAHEAGEDVKAMKRVLFHPPLGINESVIKSNTFSYID